jgi:hypothetical protein
VTIAVSHLVTGPAMNQGIPSNARATTNPFLPTRAILLTEITSLL